MHSFLSGILPALLTCCSDEPYDRRSRRIFSCHPKMTPTEFCRSSPLCRSRFAIRARGFEPPNLLVPGQALYQVELRPVSLFQPVSSRVEITLSGETAPLGIEPRPTASKTVVRPLHHEAIKKPYNSLSCRACKSYWLLPLQLSAFRGVLVRVASAYQDALSLAAAVWLYGS